MTQDTLEEVLQRGYKSLHPNHQVCLSAKTMLAAHYSNDFNPGDVEKFSDSELERKAGTDSERSTNTRKMCTVKLEGKSFTSFGPVSYTHLTLPTNREV